MTISILTCYYLWLEEENRREELPSLREPGKSQAERAVLAELCHHTAQSGWMSGFERSLSRSVSFGRTDCRTYLAFYHLNVQMTAP